MDGQLPIPDLGIILLYVAIISLILGVTLVAFRARNHFREFIDERNGRGDIADEWGLEGPAEPKHRISAARSKQA